MKQILLAFYLILTCLDALAQDSPPRRIVIPVLIWDRQHRPVPGVTKDSLVVTERKMPIPGGIDLFAASTLPLDLGILIDTSTSEREAGLLIPSVEAAKDFVTSVVRSEADRVFFETFSTSQNLSDWLTKDLWSSHVLDLRMAEGTALYDSIIVACTKRMSDPFGPLPRRRVLVVISDGEDNLSDKSLDAAIAAATSRGVMIFAVGSGARANSKRADRAMILLGSSTGGGAFVGLNRKEIVNVFSTIRAYVENTYYVSYVPPEQSKKAVHQVDIRPAQDKSLLFSYPDRYAWTPPTQ